MFQNREIKMQQKYNVLPPLDHSLTQLPF